MKSWGCYTNLKKLAQALNVDLSYFIEDMPKVNIIGNKNIVNNAGTINIAINKEDFNDEKEIQELIALLKYAPKAFIKTTIEKLKKFKELSES
jgi:hypothetical protein